MKPILSILLSTFILSGMAMADDNLGNFRHVVLFKFKEGTTEEQIANVESEFKKLPSKIDTIVDFEWGTSKTVEADLAQGYTHCFLVTFKNKAGLETYLPHPDHQAFVSIVRPLLEEVHVFDYVASK
tara:strand:+ start:6031 stop:6411 length:381 start_codon:yes stop_codon:yes gene_type:complete